MASIGDHSQAVPPECQPIVALEALIREEMIRNLSPTTKPCIYKIPQKLRDVNPKAYTPCRVAIGPYHANAEHLKSMEPYKLRYLNSLMSRSREGHGNLIRFIKAIEARESEARKCYSGIEELDSHIFKRMLLLDGAFVVEFFLSFYQCWKEHLPAPDCPILGNEKASIEVCHDLLLLENQLPFFILEDLFYCTFENQTGTFPRLAYKTLCSCSPLILSREDYLPREQVEQRTMQGKVNHLLHLLRICCLDVPTPSVSLGVQGENPSDTAQMPTRSLEKGKLRFLCLHLKIPSWWGRKEEQQKVLAKNKVTPNHFRNPASVTELREAGVQFRAKKGRFMYAKFDEATGVLEMSHLQLNDYTEIFFRNVIAYEQYYLNVFHASAYMFFMAGLIDTKKDVDILQESQVIDSLLESKEDAANIFNMVTKYTVSRESLELKELVHKLKAHTMKPWNKWNAILRRDYFGSPWAIISFSAAVVLLILTVVQTIASVRSTKWD
uniref:Uncharacterized protein n=1 Tax=Opuntia streptacantha TaxID=393608 RepID=A0A7C9AF05_OPUST